MQITKITELDGKRHIALLDTSSISFMQGLSEKGLQVEAILKDYDLILIPEWVLTEINDAPGRADYVQKNIRYIVLKKEHRQIWRMEKRVICIR